MAIDWTSRRGGRPGAATSRTGTWWSGLRATCAGASWSPASRSTATYS